METLEPFVTDRDLEGAAHLTGRRIQYTSDMVSPPYVNPHMESGHSTYLRAKNQERSEKAAVPQASSTLNQGLIAHIAHKSHWCFDSRFESPC